MERAGEGFTDRKKTKKLSGKLVWKINLRDHEIIYFGRRCAQKRKETQNEWNNAGYFASSGLS